MQTSVISPTERINAPSQKWHFSDLNAYRDFY